MGDGIIIPNNSILGIAKSFNLFHGFDEAWFFQTEPSSPMPKESSLVAPLNLNCNELAPATSSWMQEAGCKLGVGDGIGLNYVAAEEQIAKEVEFALRPESEH